MGLKNMRPLLPTLATAKCLPSRPAEVPSGAMLVLSSSEPPLLARQYGLLSSGLFFSVTGTRGFVTVLGSSGVLDLTDPVLWPMAPGARSPSFAAGPGGDLRNLETSRVEALGEKGLLSVDSRCSCVPCPVRPLAGGDCMGSSMAASIAFRNRQRVASGCWLR